MVSVCKLNPEGRHADTEVEQNGIRRYMQDICCSWQVRLDMIECDSGINEGRKRPRPSGSLVDIIQFASRSMNEAYQFGNPRGLYVIRDVDVQPASPRQPAPVSHRSYLPNQ